MSRLIKGIVNVMKIINDRVIFFSLILKFAVQLQAHSVSMSDGHHNNYNNTAKLLCVDLGSGRNVTV